MKSHVSIEQRVCIVTGQPFDNGILLDRRLQKSLESKTITGWGVSPEVQEKIDEGYVVFIGVVKEKSDLLPNGNIDPAGAYRTGMVCYLKKEAANQIFNTEINRINFAEQEVLDLLKKLQEE